MKKNINTIGKLLIAGAFFSMTLLLSMEKNKEGKWGFAFSQIMAQTSSGISGSDSGSGGSGTSGDGEWVLVGETEGEEEGSGVLESGNVSGTDECTTCVKDMMLKLKKCSKEWAKYDSDGKKLSVAFTTGTKTVCSNKTTAYCDQTKQVACNATLPSN
jgi:hypothetical protein